MVEIEHRREAEVDAVHGELRGNPGTYAFRRRGCCRRVAIPLFAEHAHRRQGAKSIAKALHPAAFVINADDEWRIAPGANRLG